MDPQDSPEEQWYVGECRASKPAPQDSPVALGHAQFIENIVGGVIESVDVYHASEAPDAPACLLMTVVHEGGPTVNLEIRDIELPIMVEPVDA